MKSDFFLNIVCLVNECQFEKKSKISMFKVMVRSTLWEEEVVMSSEINRGSLAKH